jgi:hypothetical protein
MSDVQQALKDVYRNTVYVDGRLVELEAKANSDVSTRRILDIIKEKDAEYYRTFTQGGLVSEGTPGTLAKFVDGTVLGDSIVSESGTLLTVSGSLKINTLAHETTDVDTFLVANGGLIKYRTGAEVLSDIGGIGGASLTTNYIPKATGASTIGDSGMQEDGDEHFAINSTLAGMQTGYPSLQIGDSSILVGSDGGDETFLLNNNYYSRGNLWTRLRDGYVARVYPDNAGQIKLSTAGSGIAGTTFTWTDQMTMQNGGNVTFAGKIHISDATEATTTTDGSFYTDGGLSVVKSAVIGDDLDLLSDGAILNFGADKDVNLTHVADTGLHLNGALGIGVSPSVKLDIDDGSSGSPTIYLRAGGVAHGRTDIQPTDVFGSIGTIYSGSGYTDGGLGITGISERAYASGLYLRGIIGSTNPSDSQPAINLEAGKADGSTGWAALGDDESVFGVDNYDTNLVQLYGDGDMYIKGQIFTTDWTDYSGTSTVTGWASTTTKEIHILKIGDLVYVKFHIVGTSNATSASFTVRDTSATDGTPASGANGYAADNGTPITTGSRHLLSAGSATVNLYSNTSVGTWTNSGSKEIMGWFIYRAA